MLCLSLTSAYAQQPTFQWAKHLKSDGQIGSGILDMELDKDTNGQLILAKSYNVNQDLEQFTVQLQGIKSGLYFLRLRNEKGVSVSQFFLIE